MNRAFPPVIRALSSATVHPPRAFTLVELLVVITIIAMLAGLLLPAIMSARESGRRANCMNNQKQIATAITGYVTAKDQFPPSFSVQPNPTTNPPLAVGWVPQLLPFMEQNPLYQVFQANTWANGSITDATVSILICPTGSAYRGIKTPAPLSYVVNCGMRDYQGPFPANQPHATDCRENGIFFDVYTPDYPPISVPAPPIQKVTTDASFISRHDGLTTTVLLSESLDGMDWIMLPSTLSTYPDYVPPLVHPQPTLPNVKVRPFQTWWQGMIWSLPPASSPMYQPDANFFVHDDTVTVTSHTGIDGFYPVTNAKPSSKHPGGFIATMCDGHTAFLSQDLDYRVYCLLMAPDNAHAIDFDGQPAFYKDKWTITGIAGQNIPLIPLTEADIK